MNTGRLVSGYRRSEVVVIYYIGRARNGTEEKQRERHRKQTKINESTRTTGR